jgi:hypothetical protein
MCQRHSSSEVAWVVFLGDLEATCLSFGTSDDLAEQPEEETETFLFYSTNDICVATGKPTE